MRVLITGATGACGRHLAAIAAAEGAEVVGVSRRGGGTAAAVDLTDAGAARQIVDTGFDVVFHLAFANAPADRVGDAMIMTAIRGTANLFEAIRTAARRPKTVLVGSGGVYGDVSSRVPVTEDTVPQPATLYTTLKLAQENVARGYRRAFALPLVILRPFNFIGPGVGSTCVATVLARQVVERERGTGAGPLKVGFLGGYRDFVDVRDVARACWLAAAHGRDGATYNVATGRPVRVGDLVPLMQRHAHVDIKLDEQRNPGPFDIPYSCGDARSLREHTGWRPEISLEQSVVDLLDHLRASASVACRD